MNKKRLNYLVVLLGFFVFYLFLLFVLYLSERNQPGSNINSLADAFWFSIVTISTVGYGDVTPKSPLGYAVGFIFIVMSTGMLVALFGSVVSFITSEGFPMIKLRMNRRRNWHYLAELSAESDTLARDILKEDPEAIIIFGVNRDEEAEKPDYPCLFINVSPARIVEQKKGIGEKCNVYFLKENDIGRNMKAMDIFKLPVNVYACTMSGQEKMSGNINFFHPYDCCARSYWREHPLHHSDNMIIIIGFGNYGLAMLERAILLNINDADFDVQYHIFGDAERFLNIHNHLGTAFGINEIKPGYDSLFFHNEDWSTQHELMQNADRIIICEDDEPTGWDILWQLQRYYNCKCQIDLRSNRKAPGVSYFGTNDEIYTVDQIVRTKLNYAAKAMNDLYRRSVDKSLDWDELSDQLKQSKIAVADHLYVKVMILRNYKKISELNWRICQQAYEAYCIAKEDPEKLDSLRRIEHARWVRFYCYYNWNYGNRRNDRLHENPMIVDYDMLNSRQRAYHDRAWELLGEIASLLKRQER